MVVSSNDYFIHVTSGFVLDKERVHDIVFMV